MAEGAYHVCAWCGEVKPDPSSRLPGITHGLCRSCLSRRLREVDSEARGAAVVDARDASVARLVRRLGQRLRCSRRAGVGSGG